MIIDHLGKFVKASLIPHNTATMERISLDERPPILCFIPTTSLYQPHLGLMLPEEAWEQSLELSL